MTKEQTIEKLKTLYTNAVAAMLRANACGDDESAKVMTEYAKTLDSAITALTALQTDGDCISRRVALDDIETVDPSMLLDVNWVKNWVKALPSVQPEPCDVISRADAIRIASGYCHPANVAKELAKLPSAQPEVIQCKDCKHNPKDEWFGCPMSHLNEKQRPETAWCWKGERRTDERDKT